MSDAAPSTAAEHVEWQPRVNPWLIAISVMLATFMEVLDTSIAPSGAAEHRGKPGGRHGTRRLGC